MVGRYAQSPRPAVRLGIDFGVGSLVIGISIRNDGKYNTQKFPGLSQEVPGAGTGRSVHIVPVLIHYDQDGGQTIGDEVVRAGNADHPATARWIRRYLLEESPVRIPIGADRWITFHDAAADFLAAVIARATREYPGCSSAVFAIPTDAPGWYTEWLGGIAHAQGIRSWHTLTEPAAIVAGYGVSPEAGHVYLIICWDETDFTARFVLFDDAPDRGPQVIGTASDNTGCKAVDGWIAQDVLARNNRKFTGVKNKRLRDGINDRIGELYGQLTSEDNAIIQIEDPPSGTTVPVRVSRDDVGRILKEHGVESILDCTITCARAAATSHGYGEILPVAILMTGRGCAIPAVQNIVKKKYAGIPVLSDHPFDAIARGTALFLPRTILPSQIKNDYALRYWDSKSREHRYRFLVRSGAPYPSAGQVARVTISAAYDGQTRLGIPVYEIRSSPDAHALSLELVSDTAGGVRLVGPQGDSGIGSRPILVNTQAPTLLIADPPAMRGEPRFELTFTLDRERKLRVTARDLVTGTLMRKDAPVHQLT